MILSRNSEFIIFIGLVSPELFDVILGQEQYLYVYDRTTPRDKGKLITLCSELITESKHKIHQTDSIRDNLSTRLGFQIGMIMGQIREKYKTMLELYRLTTNKHTGKSKLILPDMKYRPIHYVARMEFISNLEIEIDRLIHILEELPLKYVEDYDDDNGPKKPKHTGYHPGGPEQPPRLRMGRTSEELVAYLAEQEQELKRENRQKFLKNRLGLSSNASVPDIDVYH